MRVNVHTEFTLNRSTSEKIHFLPGLQDMSDEDAFHPFTQFHIDPFVPETEAKLMEIEMEDVSVEIKKEPKQEVQEIKPRRKYGKR